MNQVKHRIHCDLLEKELPLLFFKNALSFESQPTENSTPLQLCYPDSSTTLGFRPHSLNIYKQLNVGAENENILDHPSLIISTECKDFDNIRTDIYRWGTLYLVCIFLLLLCTLKIILENQAYMNFTMGFKINKPVFHVLCLLLSLSPLLAVTERCPFFMIMYKSLFPSMLIIIFIYFLDQIWDLMFVTLLSITRFSITNIQYIMVSLLIS